MSTLLLGGVQLCPPWPIAHTSMTDGVKEATVDRSYIFHLVSLVPDLRFQICSPVMHPITSVPIPDSSPCQITTVWTCFIDRILCSPCSPTYFAICWLDIQSGRMLHSRIYSQRVASFQIVYSLNRFALVTVTRKPAQKTMTIGGYWRAHLWEYILWCDILLDCILSQQIAKYVGEYGEWLVSKILSMEHGGQGPDHGYLTWAWIWNRNRCDWMHNRWTDLNSQVWYQTHQMKYLGIGFRTGFKGSGDVCEVVFIAVHPAHLQRDQQLLHLPGAWSDCATWWFCMSQIGTINVPSSFSSCSVHCGTVYTCFLLSNTCLNMRNHLYLLKQLCFMLCQAREVIGNQVKPQNWQNFMKSTTFLICWKSTAMPL